MNASCPTDQSMRDFLAGSLSQAEEQALSQHVEQCSNCRQRIDTLVSASDSDVARVLRAGSNVSAQETVLRQVMDHVANLPQGSKSEELRLDFLDPPTTPDGIGRLEPYEVTGVVAKGGMGVVLRAVDTALHRSVAIKVVAPQLAGDATARRRFAREARATALIENPHVVPIYAFGEVRGLPYLVMPLVHGESLEERVRRAGPLPLEDILRIGAEVAEGLEAAHVQGLVHRDVKPANILIESPSGKVRLTDFGLARALDDPRLTASGYLAGTPQYMSPEQARGEAVDPRADLFSLGGVLYAMATGRAPFVADNTAALLYKVCEDAPPPLRQVNPALPDWFITIIGHLLRKQPADRYQSAAVVAQLLRDCLAHVRDSQCVPLPASVRFAPKVPDGVRAMSLIPCEECGREISSRAFACPHCGLRRMVGYDYQSSITIFGWPLICVAQGRDLVTGRARVAKGIIAVGEVAIGLIAIGGRAIGAVAFGGFAIGLLSFGGCTVGLLAAVGGVAVGTFAVGGCVVGGVAMGGVAYGYYALGGLVGGAHAVGGAAHDPSAVEFFRSWLGPWVK
jgi:serine/threonine protein kinase